MIQAKSGTPALRWAAVIALAVIAAACTQTSNQTSSELSQSKVANSQAVPDFTSTYDTATLTPLQRPKAFGNKLTMTRAEADKIAATEAALQSENAQSSDPNREAPPEGGDGNEALGAGGVGGYNLFWIDRGEESVAVNGEFRSPSPDPFKPTTSP